MNDTRLGGNDPAVFQRSKRPLMARRATTDFGNMSEVLGMNITRDREADWLKISQADYVALFLDKYYMSDCNPVSTPRYGPELSTAQPVDTLLDDKCIHK